VEYKDKTTCQVCKSGSLYEIAFCLNDNIPCEEDCNSFRVGLDCPVRGKKLQCDYCGSVRDAE
jgi:hypothetical protein